MLFSSRVRVRIGVSIRFSFRLVSCYERVSVLLLIVIVTNIMTICYIKLLFKLQTKGAALTLKAFAANAM